jgi:hypothetical protein
MAADERHGSTIGSWTALARGQETLSALSSPPGELVSEANDNSVAIVLIYGTARPAGRNAEAKEEEYMAGRSYTRPQTVLNVPILNTL